MKDDTVEVAVQINGKTRAVVAIAADASKEEALSAGKAVDGSYACLLSCV